MATTLFPSIMPDDEENPTPAEQLANGRCPWCDDFDGESVKRHAAQAHPDEYDEVQE